jgi:hypothetical protein
MVRPGLLLVVPLSVAGFTISGRLATTIYV